MSFPHNARFHWEQIKFSSGFKGTFTRITADSGRETCDIYMYHNAGDNSCTLYVDSGPVHLDRTYFDSVDAAETAIDMWLNAYGMFDAPRQRCECGAHKAGDQYHAKWCPIYVDPMAPRKG